MRCFVHLTHPSASQLLAIFSNAWGLRSSNSCAEYQARPRVGNGVSEQPNRRRTAIQYPGAANCNKFICFFIPSVLIDLQVVFMPLVFSSGGSIGRLRRMTSGKTAVAKRLAWSALRRAGSISWQFTEAADIEPPSSKAPSENCSTLVFRVLVVNPSLSASFWLDLFGLGVLAGSMSAALLPCQSVFIVAACSSSRRRNKACSVIVAAFCGSFISSKRLHPREPRENAS